MEASTPNPLREFPDAAYWKLQDQLTAQDVELAQLDTVLVPAGYAYAATTGKDVFLYILGLKEPYTRKEILSSYQRLAEKWNSANFTEQPAKEYAAQVMRLIDKAKNQLIQAHNPLAEFPDVVYWKLHQQITPEQVESAQTDTIIIPAGYAIGATTGKDVFRYLLGLKELSTFKDIQESYQKKAAEWNPAQAQDASTKEFLTKLVSLITHAKNELVRTHNPLAEFPNAAYLQNQLTLDQVEKAQWNSVLLPGGYLYGATVNGEDLFRSILGLDKYKTEPLKWSFWGWEPSDNSKAIEAAYNKLAQQWNPNLFQEQAQKDLATKIMRLLEKARAEAIKADIKHTEDTKTRVWGKVEAAAKYYGAK